MAKGKASLATMQRTIGTEAIEKSIRKNHLFETRLSPTCRSELERQLSSPTAGILAHLKSCSRCRREIERTFAEMTIPVSGGDAALATAPATI